MAPALELDVSKGSNLKSVTVYGSGKAEVRRKFDVELNEGDNEVRITGLSCHVDPQSVRISGFAPAVRLVDVSCTVGTSTGLKLGSPLRKLHDKKDMLQAERLIRQQENDIYLSYAQKISSESVPADQFVRFMQTFVSESMDISRALANLDEQIAYVEQAISLIVDSQKAGRADGQVAVHLYLEPGKLDHDEGRKQATGDEVEAQFAPDKLMEGWTALSKLTHDKAETQQRANQGQRKVKTASSLDLTYFVSNASWEPVYDLHAAVQDTSSTASLKLHYRAFVTQSTGEDWVNTPLILSTASDGSRSVAIPRLPTYHIKQKASIFGKHTSTTGTVFGQQQQQNNVSEFGNGLFGSSLSPFSSSLGGPGAFTNSSAFGATAGAQPATGSLFGATAPPAPAFGQPAESVGLLTGFGSLDRSNANSLASASSVITADGHGAEPTSVEPLSEEPTLSTSPLLISYAINHPVHIPSDGASHIVTVTTIELDTTISRICIPRMEAAVYLQCEVRNESDFCLLPGTVNVFLNGTNVSQTSIQSVMPHGSFECALGIDPALRVTYEPMLTSEQNTQHLFAEGRRIRKHAVRTLITSNHPHAIEGLVVRDALPIAPTLGNVKVSLRQPEGLAELDTDGELDVREGVKVRWCRRRGDVSGQSVGHYEWVVNLESAKGCVLETEWEVQVPSQNVWEVVAEVD